jgi:hypothetical protein
MGSRSKTVQTQNTKGTESIDRTTGPTEMQKPMYDDLFKSAQMQFNSGSGFNASEQMARDAAMRAAGGNDFESRYTQQMDANARGMNQYQRQAMDAAGAAAMRSNTGAAEARALALRQLNGDFLHPESNPYLQANINAAIDPAREQLMRQVMPRINDQAIAQGAYGGSRNGIQTGLAASEFGNTAARIGAQMTADNYSNERQIQQNSPALLEQALGLDMQPAAIYGQMGQAQMESDDRQAGLLKELGAFTRGNELDRARIYEGLGSGERNMGWGNLNNYAQILGAGGFNRTTGTNTTDMTTRTTAPTGGLGGLMQGAVGGASAGSLFGPWGAGIGGVLGGLGGLFG